MNAQGQYLAWLRKTAPGVYVAALRKVAGRPRGLGGLRDDLLARMSRPSTGFGFLGDDSTDLQTVTVTASAPDYSSALDTSQFVLNPDDLSSLNDTLSQATLQQSVSLPEVTAPGTAVAPATTAPAASGSSGVFASIVNAVAAVTTAGMQASSQSNLVKLNTQRAAAGLPPVNANGVPIASSFFTPSSNPTIAALENSITGVASSPVLWIGLLALGGLLLLRSKRT